MSSSTLSLIRSYPTANGKHIPALRNSGVNYVKTPAMVETFVKLQEVTAHAGILVGLGGNGCGKSVAVERSIEQLIATTGHRLIRIEATSAAETKLVTAMLANEVGVDVDMHDMPSTRFFTGEALEHQKAIVWLDEAGHLAADLMLAVRGWHDRAECQWTLILTGPQKLEKRLRSTQPELLSRSAGLVRFEPMDEPASLRFAQELHPRFAATDVALLGEAHASCTGGVPRRWAFLLAACLARGKGGAEAGGGFSRTILASAVKAVGQ